MSFSELKIRARGSMQGRTGTLILCSLIYLGLGMTVNFVLQGTASEDTRGIVTGLTLCIDLLLGILEFGYLGLCLDASRDEPLEVNTLFAGTGMVGKVIGLVLLRSLLIFVWVLPALAVVLAGAMVSDLAAGLLAIPAACYAAWVSARYMLATYVLWDKPELGAMGSLRVSAAMMRGHALEFILLQLSFLGWLILGAFTFGILYLWVMPYMNITLANFYRTLGGDGLREPPEAPETPQQPPHDDLHDAFTSSAYRDDGREDR